MQLPETHCARARESISAQLDGELPEPELDRLEAHLLVCADCSVWAEQVRDLTAQLRATSLEEPGERFVPVRRRRARAAGPAALVAAAAASLMVVLGSSHSLTLGSSQPAHSRHVSPQVSGTPAVIGLENARLGLYSLPPRASVAVSHGRFHAV